MKKNNSGGLVTRGILKEELTKELDRVIRRLRDDIFTKLDFIVKELENMREDRDLAVYQTDQLRKVSTITKKGLRSWKYAPKING